MNGPMDAPIVWRKIEDGWELGEIEWPNCSVPDCDFKSCESMNSDKCYPHTMGRNPKCSFEEYMNGAEA